MRVLSVVNLRTGEQRPVELEIGQLLWIRYRDGSVEPVSKDQLAPEVWELRLSPEAGSVECRFS